MSSPAIAAQINQLIDEKYIPLERNIKLIIMAVLLILPPACFYFGFYQDNVMAIEGSHKNIKNLTAEITRAKRAAANKSKHEEEERETKKQFEELSLLLPRAKEIPVLLRSISDLGKVANLEFLSFVPGGEAPKEFYADIQISISIRGPYHNLGYFLDQVAKLDRIVTVDNISMGSPKKDGNEMVLSASCQLRTYRFTDKGK